MMASIEIDQEKCIQCGECARACSANWLSWDGGEVRRAQEGNCNLCGHCLGVCPAGAVSIEGLSESDFPEIPRDFQLSPDTLFTFLRSRRSCRVFAEKEVSRPVLDRLIDAARYAPTGGNSQNFQFLVIQNRELIRTLAERTAAFSHNVYTTLTAPGAALPPWVETHLRGLRLNWEYHQAGKDRIFRKAPALIAIHAPAENMSSAQNCALAMAHIMLQAQAMGLGTCIIGYLLTAAERDPSIIRELQIPRENKIFTCCTVGYPALKFKRLVYRRPPAVRWL